MDKKTNELKNILSYINDILILEAPSNEITVDYLLTAILDEQNCHAHFIIEECISSDSIEKLRTIYDDFLQSKNKNNSITIITKKYSDEVNKILHFAEEEMSRSGSEHMGTEHVLLALLNKDSGVSDKTLNILQNVGLTYPLVLSKCVEVQQEVERMAQQKKKNEKKHQQLISPFGGIVKDNNNSVNSYNNLGNNTNDDVNTSSHNTPPKQQTATINTITNISKYTTNITQLARDGKLPKLVGRERELSQIVKTLARKRKNNVVLVGQSGCGKTQIVYGLANYIISEEVPPVLEGKEILLLNIMAMVSGTHLRGMFEDRVRQLFDELKKNKKYILFLDNMQHALKTNSKESDTDISSTLGDVLAGGDIRIIGTVTPKAYHSSVENNQAIASKIQKIMIEPLNIEETTQVINHIKDEYEEYHNVFFPNNVVKYATKLAERYITTRCLPDSAIDVIDLCGAQTVLTMMTPEEITNAKNRLSEINLLKMKALADYDFTSLDNLCDEEKKLKVEIATFNKEYAQDKEEFRVTISENDVAQVISDMCGIPSNKLSVDEKKKIAHIEDILKKSIIGQDEAIESICKAIKRNKVGLNNPNKPLLTALCIGQSGTGKTLVAKKLAEEIYGDENALIRIDMSEYSEKNSVTKLTGSAPGYIGYDQGGHLTEAIKNKQYCVLLLDEIEKADESIYNIFLQLFDEGRLTDSSGTLVNFKNVVILMTSNVGAKKASELGGGIGFNSDEVTNKKSIIDKELRKKFTPEFLNRIDKIVHFNSLTDENLKTIVKLECGKFSKRMADLGLDVDFDEEVYDVLHKEAISKKEYGARPIIRIIQDKIEDEITELLLENDYEKGYVFRVYVKDDKIKIE